MNARLNNPVNHLSAEDHKIEYVDCGKLSWYVETMGQGTPCLLLHGTGSSAHSWRRLMPLLAKNHRVIAIDLPGHARTGAGASKGASQNLSLEGMAQDIRQFLDTFVSEPVIGIGHSASAAILAQIGLTAPHTLKSIISVNGAIVPLDGFAGFLFPPIARLSAGSSLLSSLFINRLRNPEVSRKLLSNTGSTIDAQSTEDYMALCQDSAHIQNTLNMMASWKLDELYPKLSELTLPVYLVASAKDQMVPVRHGYLLRDKLAHAELTVVQNVGHLAHEEQPSAIADLILGYIAKQKNFVSIKTKDFHNE